MPIWTNNQIHFAFAGESGVTYFIEASEDLQNWVPVATNSDSSITRAVTIDAQNGMDFFRASRALLPMFSAGLVAKQDINLNGNNIYVDAYDSADPSLFPGGLWNSTNAFAGGDVASLGGLLKVGNSDVHGRLLLGPGASNSIAFGLVGDMPANWPAQTGIEGPDWELTNFTSCLPDVSVPYTSGLDPIITGNGTNQYILGSGNYLVVGDFIMANNKTLLVAGNPTLYVSGSFDAKAGSHISITPGSSLKLFVGQSSGAFSAANLWNVENAGNAFNLQIFGLPTCASVGLAGTNGCIGTIYAPEADFIVNNGAISTFVYQGACVAKSITLNGHFDFHFDQNLKTKGPIR